MILLTSTSDLLTLVTGGAQTIDVHASWIDFNGSTVTPGRTNTLISTAATTTVVPAPASSVQRNVKTLIVRNRDTVSCQITIKHTDGSSNVQLMSLPLGPSEELTFSDEEGWQVTDTNGNQRSAVTSSITGVATTLTSNLTIVANTALIVPKKYTIQSGVKLKLSAGAKLRVI